MSTQEKFEEAQARVKTLSRTPSNDQLLALYSLFKQAASGDVAGKRPGMLDIKGRAKFDAWTGSKGMSTEDAMAAYVELVDKLIAGQS